MEKIITVGLVLLAVFTLYVAVTPSMHLIVV